MVCLPVCGDNSGALASGLSHIQVLTKIISSFLRGAQCVNALTEVSQWDIEKHPRSTNRVWFSAETWSNP